MRTLTILRQKTFVASLGKMRVYIEDHNAYDLALDGVPCRKLGTLKNGEQKSFEIPEQAARLFVIADNLSADYCSELYVLPEGSEDVFLTGKNKFNPTRGNPFRFDNNDSEAARSNRKRGGWKSALIFISAIIVGVAVGTSGSRAFLERQREKPKDFSVNDFTITLTEEFEQVPLENYTAAFESDSVVVLLLEESFSLIDGFEDYTLEQYAALVLENLALDTTVQYLGEIPYFEFQYQSEASGQAYRYVTYLYKENDAFWVLQLITPADAHTHPSSEEETFANWAQSVRFD